MNEMFAFGGTEHISLPCRGLSRDDAQRQHLADTKAPQAEEEGSTFLLKYIHDNLL
jgi:hypothetical protein